MSYIPANPHFAIVNCKIGDLNLTPIPPDSLESFTYERDTNQGMGNKFTIVVHDETAIVMESYLAEVAFKAMNSESYDFGGDLTNIYDEHDSSDDVNRIEYSGQSTEDTDTPAAQSISTFALLNDTPTTVANFASPTYSSGIYDSDDDNDSIVIHSDNKAAIRARDIHDNTTPFSSIGGDTNTIGGGTGVTSTVNETPIVNTNIPVAPNKIDNSKLEYADPVTGLREFYGMTVPYDTWIGIEALDEFRDGYDPSGD